MRKLKKAVATATAIAAVAASTLPAFATTPALEWGQNGGQDVREGGTYVVEPVIEVELPGDLTFGINPLKLDVSEEEGVENRAQIISGTYLVTNYSNVPVEVTAATSVTASDSVELMTTSMTASAWDKGGTGSSAYDNKQLKAVDGKKAVLLVQLYPQAITNDGEMTVTHITPGTSLPANIAGDILGETAPANPVCFLLSAFDEEKANESMAGFQFDGAVDSGAAFTEDDIKVSTIYTMNILTEEQKSNTTKYTKYVTNGANKTTTYAATIKAKN